MLRVVVLGAAAGGGVPQWNCGCAICRAARTEHSEIRNTQASIAFSNDVEHWFLVNASPDLRQQVTQTPQLHPKPGALRHSPITGVILTNGEIDAVTGLLSMRESSPFAIYAHATVLAILASNSMFDVLRPELLADRPLVDQEQRVHRQVLELKRHRVRFHHRHGRVVVTRLWERVRVGQIHIADLGREAFFPDGCRGWLGPT